MLGQRTRRWPNIEPALGECLTFAVFQYHALDAVLLIPMHLQIDRSIDT